MSRTAGLAPAGTRPPRWHSARRPACRCRGRR